MRIKRKYLIWLIFLIPFLKPDSVGYFGLGKLWNFAAYIVFIFGSFQILRYFFIKKKKPNSVVVFLSLFYLLQIAATAVNGLDVHIDIINFIKYSVLAGCIMIFTRQYGIEFIAFVYKLFKWITLLNLITVILFYNKGLMQDSYNTPIYFWSTRNHFISLLLATFVLGSISVIYGYEKRKSYKLYIVIMLIQLLLLRSSTAIIATFFFLLFTFLGNKIDNNNRVLSIKNAIIGGVVLQILVVVFRIQEKFNDLLQLLFGKDSTLSARTGLWDQALSLIGINYLWGNGNSSAKGQSGWLTMSFWDSLMNQMKDVYYIAHNQFLEILLNGGIVVLLPFILMFIFLGHKIKGIKNKRIQCIMAGAMFSYFVVMITEIVYPYEPMYILFVICSVLCQLEPNRTNENKIRYVN